ncbi:MAG TPA: 5-formyltetrahydrofolate cyclo-ligase, partial [Armatimonadota bacterium]|nr:5-formyltetrahydrofolate cyclo-ligase [Armatimonadota bacterium]
LPTAPVVAPQEVGRVVDVAVLVGLAFGRGNLVRLGYGAGFFDRFLSAHPVYAIGLCYDELLVDGLPRSEWDVPMHAVVTDRRVLFRV